MSAQIVTHHVPPLPRPKGKQAPTPQELRLAKENETRKIDGQRKLAACDEFEKEIAASPFNPTIDPAYTTAKDRLRMLHARLAGCRQALDTAERQAAPKSDLLDQLALAESDEEIAKAIAQERKIQEKATEKLVALRHECAVVEQAARQQEARVASLKGPVVQAARAQEKQAIHEQLRVMVTALEMLDGVDRELKHIDIKFRRATGEHGSADSFRLHLRQGGFFGFPGSRNQTNSFFWCLLDSWARRGVSVANLVEP